MKNQDPILFVQEVVLVGRRRTVWEGMPMVCARRWNEGVAWKMELVRVVDWTRSGRRLFKTCNQGLGRLMYYI